MKKNDFKVAIIGRPNVGKSRLFNRLIGKRKAVIDEFEGVTRDIIIEPLKFQGKLIRLIDTGGIGLKGLELEKLVHEKAIKTLNESDLVIFVCDITTGITSLDKEIAEVLRTNSKRVVLVINKSDNSKKFKDVLEFYELGIGDPMPVSAIHGIGIDALLKKIFNYVEKTDKKEDNIKSLIKFTFVGRPNVGKSSFLNSLLKQDRVIVDNKPGTTRDSINTEFEYKDEKYILIDTSGIRHRSKISSKVDAYSIKRSIESIDTSDVCLVIIDGWDGLVKDDIRIIDEVFDRGKGCLIVVNKWDLIKEISASSYVNYLVNRMKKIRDIPVMFTSAKNNYNTLESIELSKTVYRNWKQWIVTSKLNKVIEIATKQHIAPVIENKNRLKIFYCTQISTAPPIIKFFVNNKNFVSFQYMSYIERKIRENFNLNGVPLRFTYESSHKDRKKLNNK